MFFQLQGTSMVFLLKMELRELSTDRERHVVDLMDLATYCTVAVLLLTLTDDVNTVSLVDSVMLTHGD